METDTITYPKVEFAPRRLAHVNLWVSDLENSIRFYETVCGLELVRRERDLLIAFHSNGNTHHDIGVIEISRGRDRYGRDGMIQIPKTRGLTTGLNHLGWEMDNEAQLVQAYQRAQALGFPVQRTVDHLISHSVYISDPDGNEHELYADQLNDWRSIYNLEREEEVTGRWDPLAIPPKHDPHYNVDPPIRRVEGALLHPSHLTGACFNTRQFDVMRDFFVSIVGLRLIREENAPQRRAYLAGACGRIDLTLREVGDDSPVGLHQFRLRLNERTDLAQAAERLRAAGHRAQAGVDSQGSPELLLLDPDGFTLVFHQADA